MSLDLEKRFLSVLDKHAPFCQRKVRNCHAPYLYRQRLKAQIVFARFTQKKVLMHPEIRMTGRNSKSLGMKLTP